MERTSADPLSTRDSFARSARYLEKHFIITKSNLCINLKAANSIFVNLLSNFRFRRQRSSCLWRFRYLRSADRVCGSLNRSRIKSTNSGSTCSLQLLQIWSPALLLSYLSTWYHLAFVFAGTRRFGRIYFTFLSTSLYVSKRGAYWDRLCRDVVGRWLVGRWLSRACTVSKRCILGL